MKRMLEGLLAAGDWCAATRSCVGPGFLPLEDQAGGLFLVSFLRWVLRRLAVSFASCAAMLTRAPFLGHGRRFVRGGARCPPRMGVWYACWLAGARRLEGGCAPVACGLWVQYRPPGATEASVAGRQAYTKVYDQRRLTPNPSECEFLWIIYGRV